MSDLANNAVSGNDKQAFSNFRKLTALGIALDPTGIAGQAAAKNGLPHRSNERFAMTGCILQRALFWRR